MGGEGYIPAREIEAYCRLAGMDDPGERLAFFRLIRAMDGAFLDHRSKVAEKKAEEEKAGKRRE